MKDFFDDEEMGGEEILRWIEEHGIEPPSNHESISEERPSKRERPKTSDERWAPLESVKDSLFVEDTTPDLTSSNSWEDEGEILSEEEGREQILSWLEKHGVSQDDETPIEPPSIAPVKTSNLDNDESGKEEILRFISANGVEIKDDSPAQKRGLGASGELYRRRHSMERRVDLHGKTLAEVQRLLPSIFDECRAVGVRQILLIHGRGLHSIGSGGEDVLRQGVRRMLAGELRYRVESWKFASGAEGGDGATRVFLR